MDNIRDNSLGNSYNECSFRSFGKGFALFSIGIHLLIKCFNK